jgi:hypothetical protein
MPNIQRVLSYLEKLKSRNSIHYNVRYLPIPNFPRWAYQRARLGSGWGSGHLDRNLINIARI